MVGQDPLCQEVLCDLSIWFTPQHPIFNQAGPLKHVLLFVHCLQGTQSLLQLPRPALLQLLYAAPSLAVSGPKAVEEQLQRVAWGLGLSAAGPEAAQLLQVLPALGMDAVLDPLLAVQRVSCVVSELVPCFQGSNPS
jgi:hypothetical protein